MFFDKLNIIIQLPCVIKSQRQQDKALKRRREIEKQLIYNPYDIICINIDENYKEVNKCGVKSVYNI